MWTPPTARSPSMASVGTPPLKPSPPSLASTARSLHFESFMIQPNRNRSTEDPIPISLPQNADDQISSSFFFFFIALELSDSASRLSLQWPWEASISNGQFQAPTFPCVYVSEFESVRVIGFANLEVKNFVGFFFFCRYDGFFLSMLATSVYPLMEYWLCFY